LRFLHAFRYGAYFGLWPIYAPGAVELTTVIILTGLKVHLDGCSKKAWLGENAAAAAHRAGGGDDDDDPEAPSRLFAPGGKTRPTTKATAVDFVELQHSPRRS
jgi:hypothetical protein